MIRLHHLNQSRSFRVLWLLEELALPYELIEHTRDAATRLAPPSLEDAGMTGKAPMIEDDGRTIVESGAILDYIVRRHGNGRFAPDPASPDYDTYQMWLHYAEGSAMLPVMIDLYAKTRGAESAMSRARVDDELTRHRAFIAAALEHGDWLVGNSFSAADIQLAMPAELLDRTAPGSSPPAIGAWLKRLKDRPAYTRALEIGGEPLLQRRSKAA